MRGPVKGGARANGSSQALTAVVAEFAGTGASIDVPVGHVAVVQVSVFLSPSGNTVGGGLMLDGAAVSPQASLNTQYPFSSCYEVGPGKHRIAVAVYGNTAAGTAQWAAISWVIVPRGER